MPNPLSPEESRLLLRIAARSIAAAARREPAPRVDPRGLPPALREPRATFVTLRAGGELRGCRGSLAATEPLAQNVARSARAAAAEDDRFEPVREEELNGLEIHVSILGEPEPIDASSEAALLRALRPGRDGLILREGAHLGLFLPAVWEALPDPREFVARLRAKAGIPADRWPPALRAERFDVVEIAGRHAVPDGER